MRRTFARIAADETRHAALSWAVARWAERRLDAAARARIAAARVRRSAVWAAARAGPPSTLLLAGPTRPTHAALVAGMIQGLGLA